jgi:5-methylcytosine-specific restriction protein A
MKLPKPKKRPWIVKSDKQIWGRPEDQKIYKSARWRRVRNKILSEDPLCECGKLSTTVDHIIPIKDGGEVWNRDNLQGMCKNCHNKKSAKESNQ